MRKADYWKDELQGAFYVAGLFLFGASILIALAAAFIFFVQGCVPTLTAASDKFAKSVVESMGEDFEEHGWKIDKKDGGKERAKKDDQNETSKNVEQDSAGLEGA